MGISTLVDKCSKSNYVEAAHRKVYLEFIEGIRKIQRGRDAYYEQLIAEKAPNQKLSNTLRLMNAF